MLSKRAFLEMPRPEDALKGRSQPIYVPKISCVKNNPINSGLPGIEKAIFAMGCFWGAERVFWELDGVFSTAVGYCGGFSPNPTYEEVCSGRTGHAESVLVEFESFKISYRQLVEIFFESHDPTSFMRQGNDVGTQYRSAIFALTQEQLDSALEIKDNYQALLNEKKLGKIVTEVKLVREFYFAEEYHQQYLFKNPFGYCGLKSLGISFRDG